MEPLMLLSQNLLLQGGKLQGGLIIKAQNVFILRQ
jgi:hypothetical protein